MDKPHKGAMLDTISFRGIDQIGLSIEKSNTLIVTDHKILSLYGSSFPDCHYALIPEGEAAKSWGTLLDLYGHCADLGVDRNWNILAIGGGSVSDIAGFLAHTWMRGIGFSVVPTTLLAMTDAALGGKNGLDFKGYKNVVGSFQLPDNVFCDIETLRTLDAQQFASGMAEVVKHAIIDGENYFSFLEMALPSKKDGVGARTGDEEVGSSGFDHAACPSSLLLHMVSESQRVKLSIVERDPKESGERRILNLGHTFGHAVELVSGIPHGYAVSIGIALACSFSLKRNEMKPVAARRILSLLAGYGLPVDPGTLAFETKKIVPAGSGPNARKDYWGSVADALFMDKKREGGYMNLVIPLDIGVVNVEKIEIDELKAFLDEVAS
ncbi:MAG: 3-dehydroquinate synthase family protein [Candidatus Hydrogenedentales bacterium]